MILTVTPNPSVDFLFSAERLVWDDANRVAPPRRRPGGQGINVVRAVTALDPGADTLAIAPLGGAAGEEIRRALLAEGTPIHPVPLDGETRIFVGARESGTGRSLLLNPRGPRVDERAATGLLDALERALAERARRGPAAEAWVAACGSLLPGLPEDFYASVGEIAHGHGARFVPDCDGPALAAAVGIADLLVPNDMEAARLVGADVDTPEAAAAAGRSLLERGPGRVVVTLGHRGAVAVSREGAWWARPRLPAELAREIAAGSAVGAGDAFLAGLLLSRAPGEDAGEPRRLADAVAIGTAALLSRAGDLVEPGAVERVRPHVEVRPLGGG